jgi:hypothetical protein
MVPTSDGGQKIPCRHIPLTSKGETLDFLYDYGTQQEIEEALRGWLRAMIQRMDAERKAPQVAANCEAAS